MKRLNETTGNGHLGYHNITDGGGSSTNNGSGETSRQDSLSHPLEHFRRPSVGGGGSNSEILLDLLHCSPQHQQQQGVNSAHVLYQHPGYQLLSAPSSSRPVQYPPSYNHYGFPAFAAAMAAGGHCASQMPTTPESTHTPFSSTGPFNLQSIFSSRAGGATNYNNPLTVGPPPNDGLASAALNDNATPSLPPPASVSDNVFCPAPPDLKIRLDPKLENEENDKDDDGGNIASVLNAALKKEPRRSVVKKPKTEPDDTGHNGDVGGPSGGFVMESPSSATTPARVIRRSGNGGRGSRGSGAHGCPYCPKKFTETREAEAHQETCVRQRPFDCTHCGRRFRQKTSLVQHLRIHTDTRPYQCRFCARNFKQKSHLDQHERIHTGAKPYLCKFCSKAFRQKSGQASHELTHTNAMVQKFQAKHDEGDGQQEELSEEEDADEEEGENDAEDDDVRDHPLRVAEEETSHLRHHSSSLSTDDVFDGNLKTTDA